ncbi:hypothetical protein CRUP_017501 [Coryphaenoides rupestris]|nr:hypothetical protein CRUP_017501 [Coryphaenoides rupestris]
MKYKDHRYGLSRDTIEEVAREGLACCVHLELECTAFEPRYVLLIPTQPDRYAQSLTERGLYTPAQIGSAAARLQVYGDTNRERPGFFDNVIPCDDQEEAYGILTKVVRDYLGLEEQGDALAPDRALDLDLGLGPETRGGSLMGLTPERLKEEGGASIPDTPRSGAPTPVPPPSPSSSSSAARPGSDTRPVLPPIPLGRKTPALPSPAHTPTPASPRATD